MRKVFPKPVYPKPDEPPTRPEGYWPMPSRMDIEPGGVERRGDGEVERRLFIVGAVGGLAVFLMILVVAWMVAMMARIGEWDVVKAAALASLVLAIACVCIAGGGELAVRIGTGKK